MSEKRMAAALPNPFDLWNARSEKAVDVELDSLFKSVASQKRPPPTQPTSTDQKPSRKRKLDANEENQAKKQHALKKDAVAEDHSHEEEESYDADVEGAVEVGEELELDLDEAGEVDEDDDDAKPEAKKNTAAKSPRDLTKDIRTIFVGNLSKAVVTSKEDLKTFKTFVQRFGKVESIRFRSIAFAAQIPRRAAYVTKQLHPLRDTLHAYVVYVDEDSVTKALAEGNAQVVLGNHLRIDRVGETVKYDHKRSVFVGNLSFDIADEPLWTHFSTCGTVENVRVVRDKKTNVGKGFAYVQFKDRASVGLALKLDETKIGERAVRVRRCTKETGRNSAGKDKSDHGNDKKTKGKEARQRMMMKRAKNALEGKASGSKLGSGDDGTDANEDEDETPKKSGKSAALAKKSDASPKTNKSEGSAQKPRENRRTDTRTKGRDFRAPRNAGSAQNNTEKRASYPQKKNGGSGFQKRDYGGKTAGSYSNGQPQNGRPQYGRAQNGRAQNGRAQNGRATNGRAHNGRAQYGRPQHGRPQDGRPQTSNSRPDRNSKSSPNKRQGRDSALDRPNIKRVKTV
ncbi:hypothetical protein BJ742DRAFT_363851 [Cladochytrium replicatum]|nr:hypothetical protein BJ742DRAFT_363851 [Cladochytrium replicatum]